ncbi:MAG: hypothetical protein QM757_34900 [Paludibaculum sp.]
MSHERNSKRPAGSSRLWAGAVVLGLAGLAMAATPAKPEDVFQNARIWTVHLKFTAEQWAAIEPKGGGGFPGGPEWSRRSRRTRRAGRLRSGDFRDARVHEGRYKS